MKSKILKLVLFSALALIVIGSVFIVTPRVWSGLNPEKPPVGYHFISTAYMALALGLEELIDIAPAIPDEIEGIMNIEYKNVGGKSLQLDIYRPKNLSKPVPLLVFIHGGGWKGGKRSDYLVYLVDFAKQGYMTATVSYRLRSDSIYPACVEDIKDAVNWFYSNGEKYGYDPARIALIGGSAGAHLSLLAAYDWEPIEKPDTGRSGVKQSNRIKAVVDIYGPADLTTEYGRKHIIVTSFMGHSFEENPELYKEASPVQYLDRNDPPTLILHGTSDQLVPVSQSYLLKEKLDSLGVPCKFYPVPLWPHTMDIVKRVNVYCKARMSEFFKEYLD